MSKPRLWDWKDGGKLHYVSEVNHWAGVGEVTTLCGRVWYRGEEVRTAPRETICKTCLRLRGAAS